MKKKMTRRLKLLAAAVVFAGLAGGLGAQDGGFRFDGPIGRVITPNGDLRNDELFICFGNPSDSEVETRIFTLWGAEVARVSQIRSQLEGCPRLTTGARDQHAKWDGRSHGSFVKSGVYIYQVKAEGRTYSGTLLVVR